MNVWRGISVIINVSWTQNAFKINKNVLKFMVILENTDVPMVIIDAKNLVMFKIVVSFAVLIQIISIFNLRVNITVEINIIAKKNVKMPTVKELVNMTLQKNIKYINVASIIVLISVLYVRGNAYFQIICIMSIFWIMKKTN